MGRHCQTEMKVASKKRKEGRKAETKTSDKENESVQRKWPGGVAPPEESPTAWCFLSSQRLGVGGGSWPTVLSPRHLGSEAARQLWKGRPPLASPETGQRHQAQSPRQGLDGPRPVGCFWDTD